MANNHLIIGLGGTGGQVIREYRELFVKKHQSLDGLDNVKFLWFDTSKGDMDKSEDWKVNGISIELENNVERHYMKTHDNNLFDILNNTSSYPQVSSWISSLDKGWKNINSKVVDGASGQIRKLGRVNFALYVNNFNAKVKERINALTVGKTNQSVDIHIVAGLAGGTGSGSYIDAVAQILETDNGINAENVFVYVLTPNTNIEGEKTGEINKVSLYYANGYAALKELNAFSLASGEEMDMDQFDKLKVDTLGALNVYDLTTEEFGKKLYDRKRHQAAYIITDEAVSGSDFTNMSEPQRWLNTANWLYIKTRFDNKSFNAQRDRIETGENSSNTPASLWGQSANNIGVGTMRLMVPKQEMRDYFKNYFLLNALKKIQYNNFKEKEGFLKEPKIIDPNSEIETHKHLMREWSLTLPQLSQDKIDAEAPRIHRNFVPKDFSIEEEIKININELSIHIERFGYKDSPVEPVDHLSILNTAGLNYIRNEFRTVGATKYFQDWSKSDNILTYTDYIKKRIITNIFGYNSRGSNNWTPLHQVVGVVKYARQDYLNQQKIELLNRIQACDKIRKSKISDFNSLETEYKKPAGIFGKRAKRSDSKTKAQNVLIELYTTMIEEESYNFALDTITELQKNTLVEVEKIVEQASNGVKELIGTFYKQLTEQDPRRNKGKGTEAYSPDNVINKIEEYLNRNESDLGDYIRDIESQMYSEINLLTEGKTKIEDIINSLDGIGAIEADKGLKKNTADLNLDYDIYKDNLITILFKDFGGDANNKSLKEMISDIYIKAAPSIKFKETTVRAKDVTMVILPMLIDVEDDKEIEFKKSLETVIKSICGEDTLIINTVEDDEDAKENKESKAYLEAYDEIVMARFKTTFPLSNLEIIQKKLYNDYITSIDTLNKKGIDAKFLMHLQDVSHAPEIIPINDKRRMQLYRPLVLLLQAMDAFNTDTDILKIEELNEIDVPILNMSYYFESSIEETLKARVFIDQDRIFSGWEKANENENKQQKVGNKWLESDTYYRLKELTYNKVADTPKAELLENVKKVFNDLKKSDPTVFNGVSTHFNEINEIIEYIHSNK